MLNAFLWNLLLATVLAMILTLAGRLSALRRRPGLRHLLWLLLIAKLVTPPFIRLPVLPAAIDDPVGLNAGSSAAFREETAVAPQVALLSESAHPVLSRGGLSPEVDSKPMQPSISVEPSLEANLPWVQILLAVSTLGTGILWFIHLVRGVRLGRWLSRAALEDESLAVLCEEVAEKLGVRRHIPCRLVDAHTAPLLWGIFRPTIIMPRRLTTSLDTDQVRGILAHEIAHYVRRDQWSNTFAFFVKTLMWWNPVAWWAHRQLRDAQELCCDAIAIDACNRRCYATTLFRALDFVQTEQRAPSVFALAMGGRKTILRRFEMIADDRLSHRLSRTSRVLLLLLTASLLTLPVSGQRRSPAANDDAPENRTIANQDKTETKAREKSAAEKSSAAASKSKRFDVEIELKSNPPMLSIRGKDTKRVFELLQGLKLGKIKSDNRRDHKKKQAAAAPLELRTYRLRQIQPQMAMDVLKVLLAGRPMIRLGVDSTHMRLVALAPAAEQKLIGQTLEKLEGAEDPPAEAGRSRGKLKLAYRATPWKDVFKSFAGTAGLSVVIRDEVPGTFSYRDEKSYTPSEALDLLNSVLLTKGFAALRRDDFLFVVDLERGLPKALVPVIKADELNGRGRLEFATVAFPAAQKDLEKLKTDATKLLGPAGSVVILRQSRQLQATARVVVLRQIRALMSPAKERLRR